MNQTIFLSHPIEILICFGRGWVWAESTGWETTGGPGLLGQPLFPYLLKKGSQLLGIFPLGSIIPSPSTKFPGAIG